MFISIANQQIGVVRNVSWLLAEKCLLPCYLSDVKYRKTLYLYDNVLYGLINKFSQVSSFVLFSIIFIVYGLMSHSPIVCVSFSFAIEKETQ